MTRDEEKATSLQKALSINQSLCNILVQRSICSFEEAKQYFRPQLSDLHSPWLMKDMEKAVNRILIAIAQKEKILIFGDYDVDGTTSVACMYRFLLSIYGVEYLDFYIPHRYREGYGISRAGLDHAIENNYSLIITLDCGIKSVDLVDYGNASGLDFIICDHHLPDPEVPKAIAILNPKQTDCNYPYKELCGCGVGLKLITAICEKLRLEPKEYLCFIDLVATAIAADIVPLTGENRILAFHGLIKLSSDPNPGLKALIHLTGIKSPFTLQTVAFVLAPRINAAGRMDDARKAVLMFVEEDFASTLKFAANLHSDNAERRETEQIITKEAFAMINSSKEMLQRRSTVVFNASWHKGVVGIVASRLIERYYKPTVVLTQSGEIVSGSARSVHGFNLYEAVHACRDYLIGYGGHFAAAGMSMHLSSVTAFTESFEKAVSANIEDHMLTPVVSIDAEIEFRYIIPGFYNIITQMEPFGPENGKPVFLSKNIYETGYSKIVKEEHIKFVLKQNHYILTGIGFNLAEKFHLLQMQSPLDIIFTIDENEWNGERSLQLKILDIRLSDPVTNL